MTLLGLHAIYTISRKSRSLTGGGRTNSSSWRINRLHLFQRLAHGEHRGRDWIWRIRSRIDLWKRTASTRRLKCDHAVYITISCVSQKLSRAAWPRGKKPPPLPFAPFFSASSSVPHTEDHVVLLWRWKARVREEQQEQNRVAFPFTRFSANSHMTVLIQENARTAREIVKVWKKNMEFHHLCMKSVF